MRALPRSPGSAATQDRQDRLTSLHVTLLANLTHGEQGSESLLQVNEAGGALTGLHLRRLLHWFLHAPAGGEDAFEHVASVLANVTQIKAGRALFLNEATLLFRELLPQLRVPNVVRRRGCVRALRWVRRNHAGRVFLASPLPPRCRNLFFEREAHALLVGEAVSAASSRPPARAARAHSARVAASTTSAWRC